jgi:hypothetical protein
MNRDDHLQWAKQRALQALDYYGDPTKAFISLVSDLQKHPELAAHPAIELGSKLQITGNL